METHKYFLILDIGTGSGRAAIYDERGNELGIHLQEWQHTVDPRYPGSLNFDTDQNWLVLCQCIRRALDKASLRPKQISAVSATGMRIATVFYDKDSQVLFACTNTDTRAQEETAELIRCGLGPKIYEIDGEWPGFGGPSVQLLWIRKHQPEVYECIRRVTMLTDWALFKLSGEYSADPSCAGTSGMFDGRKRQWSAEIARWLDIPMDFFPLVREVGTVIGTVTARAAQETGLCEGTPVVQGGSDAGCGLAGGGSVEPGQTYIGTGSFWNSTIVTGEMILDPDARAKILPHVVPGCWQFEGVGFYTGFILRWFRDAFCQEEKRLATLANVDTYKILDEQAASVPPGSYGIQAFIADVCDNKRWIVGAPTFMGWDPNAPEQTNKAVFYRVLLENATYQMRGTFERLTSLTGLELEQAPLVGGAAKSHLWPKVLADVIGVPIKVPVVKETAALGAAMGAAVGTGMYRDLREAAQAMVSWEATFYPTQSEAVRKTYEEQFQQWQAMYPRLLTLVDEGLIPPMWRAAGVKLAFETQEAEG